MAVEAVVFTQIVDVNWDQAIYTASPNNTINVAQFAAKGSGTNIAVALTPKGTGYISAQVPDGTAAGGNARGANAVDLHTKRTVATAVASGECSALIGGQQCAASGTNSACLGGRENQATATNAVCVGGTGATASGESAVALSDGVASGVKSLVSGDNCQASGIASTARGQSTIATGEGSEACGRFSLAHRMGMFAHASTLFATQGDVQSFSHVLANKTTTNSPIELFINQAVGSVRIVLLANTVLNALVEITGIKSDGSATASYHRQVEIKRIGNTTTLIKNEVIGVDNASGTSIAITADDTNESLKITATGIASETWRWVATIRGSELMMGT